MERRNPERTSRRQTRSMGGVTEVSEEHLEQSLEEELIKVICSNCQEVVIYAYIYVSLYTSKSKRLTAVDMSL